MDSHDFLATHGSVHVNNMPNTNDPVSEFFDGYAANVAELAASVRERIRQTIPEAVETLDVSGSVVGYAIGPGYKGLVCTIIPSRTGVKLGVVGSVGFDDPEHLLEGTGKRHRYLQFNTPSDLDRRGIAELLRTAASAAQERVRSARPPRRSR
jgi:hypothetical protein